MYKSWYNVIMKSGCELDLGMTDTDSFLFRVSDKEKFMEYFNSHMDFSNYLPSNPKFSIANKAKLGFFKDELCGKFHCQEFVGLRSKCYSMNLTEIETSSKCEKKVCKGLGRTAILNRLKFEHYKTCLFNRATLRENFYSIRSVKHNLKTVLINKKALSFIDTKRWIFDCGIHSVPYGSFLIQKYYNSCPRCK